MDIPELIGQLCGWHDVLPPTSSCLAVVHANFGVRYALLLTSPPIEAVGAPAPACTGNPASARPTGLLALVRYTQTGVAREEPLRLAGDLDLLVPGRRWVLAVDARNNAYVVTTAGACLTVAFFEYRTLASWQKDWVVAGPGGSWDSVAAQADRELFVAASLTGSVVVRDMEYTGDSLVFALTHHGEVFFDHKVIGVRSATLALLPAPRPGFYVVGVTDHGAIAIHEFSKTGQVGGTSATEDLAVQSVHSAALLPRGLIAVAGTLTLDGNLTVYHLTVDLGGDSVCRVMSRAVTASAVRCELVAVRDRAVLYLQVEDQGSFLFDGEDPIHGFTDQLVPGAPQLVSVAEIEHGVIFLRGGQIEGDLYVDKSLFDVGTGEPQALVMQFISGRLRPAARS